MKFNKLVKTIDYVTYPSLQELRKINRSLGDSISKLTDIVFSAIVAAAIDKTELLQLVFTRCSENSRFLILRDIANNSSPISKETIGTIIAVILGILICVLIRITRWFYVRCRYKNKRKVTQREGIACDFYKSVIPQLITIKSLLEQHDETNIHDRDTCLLLLLQVKYEICDMISNLDRIKVLEERKDGSLLDNSKDVFKLIGSDAYFAVLEELIRCAAETNKRLKTYAERADDLVNSINDIIASSNTIQIARKRNTEFNDECNRVFTSENARMA